MSDARLAQWAWMLMGSPGPFSSEKEAGWYESKGGLVATMSADTRLPPANSAGQKAKATRPAATTHTSRREVGTGGIACGR